MIAGDPTSAVPAYAVRVGFLGLDIQSFADMTEDRVAAIGRVFDAFPEIRPTRVGGDPARIKVEPSMEALMTRHVLPFEWLTERGGNSGFGQINLHRGRGSWMGDQENGAWNYWLTGHDLEQSWSAEETVDGMAVARIAQFLELMVVAMDAAHGRVFDRDDPGFVRSSTILRQLPGIDWLTYLGPAFVDRYPKLAAFPESRLLVNGGVLIRSGTNPLPTRDERHARDRIRAEIDRTAFSFLKVNPALPSIEDHLAASPGTPEMPWITYARDDNDGKRERRYASANKRLTSAIAQQSPLIPPNEAANWSTSIDLDEIAGLARYLASKLGGDFRMPIGKALFAVIRSAPVDTQGSVRLDTELGVVDFAWLIDDITTIDLSIDASAEALTIFAARFDNFSD